MKTSLNIPSDGRDSHSHPHPFTSFLFCLLSVFVLVFFIEIIYFYTSWLQNALDVNLDHVIIIFLCNNNGPGNNYISLQKTTPADIPHC